MRFADGFSWHSPIKINCGSRALAGLPAEMRGQGVKRPLILADLNQVGRKRRDAVIDAFSDSGLTMAIYDRVPDPLEPELLPFLLTLFQDGGCDSLIAVGCDAVMDAAKCLSMLVIVNAREKKTVNHGYAMDAEARCPLFWVAVPGGNGYEATQYANDGSGLLSAPRLVPHVAFIDPVMMAGEESVVTNGGLIGLVHAVETFLDDTAGPWAHAHAHAAISLMMRALPMAAVRTGDPASLSAVVCAQLIAGCAFSSASPGTCHTLAGYLSTVSAQWPGYLMATVLPHWLTEITRNRSDQVGQLLYPMAGAEDYALTDPDLQAPRAVALIWEFYEVLNRSLSTGVSNSLNNAGLTDDQLRQASEALKTDPDASNLENVLMRAR